MSKYLAMRIALEKKAKALSDGGEDSSSIDAEMEMGAGKDFHGRRKRWITLFSVIDERKKKLYSAVIK